MIDWDISLKDVIISLSKKQDQKTLVTWACDCAEHVLPYFQEKYPEDNRPKKAIEAGHAWVRGEIKVGEARKAAFATHTAARNASQDNESEACFVARSAGHAVATVHVVGHAIHAVAYAVKATSDKVKEQKWQYKRLLSLVK